MAFYLTVPFSAAPGGSTRGLKYDNTASSFVHRTSRSRLGCQPIFRRFSVVRVHFVEDRARWRTRVESQSSTGANLIDQSRHADHHS
jgi:hypothetical protein